MANLFKKPRVPEPTPAAPMPDEEDPAIREQRRKASLDILSRSGRSSTILTGTSEDNDNNKYNRKTLGGR